MLPFAMSRREMLSRCGVGMGLLGLTQLMGDAGMLLPHAAAADGLNPLAPKKPQFPRQGRSASSTSSPTAARRRWTPSTRSRPSTSTRGKSLPATNLRTERRTGAAFPSPFKFQKYGKSGLEISELFANTAKHADDICVIRSMPRGRAEPTSRRFC